MPGSGVERPCPVCASFALEGVRTLKDHISGDDFRLGTCGDCGARFIIDAPAPDVLPRYYANPSGARMHQKPGRIFSWMRQKRIDADLRPLVERLGPSGSVVDLGAGDGSLAERLRSRGFTAGAVDMYPASGWGRPDIPYLQAAPGIGFAAPEIAGVVGRPDAVVMRHVLEHVISPFDTLMAVADAGARLVLIIVPNVAAPLASRWPEVWYYWDPPRHLTFFTPETLARVAGRAGFSVVFSRTYGLDEVVTSAYRGAALRAHASGASWARFVSSHLSPTGLLSGVASAVAAPFSRTVIHAVLARS